MVPQFNTYGRSRFSLLPFCHTRNIFRGCASKGPWYNMNHSLATRAVAIIFNILAKCLRAVQNIVRCSALVKHGIFLIKMSSVSYIKHRDQTRKSHQYWQTFDPKIPSLHLLLNSTPGPCRPLFTSPKHLPNSSVIA